MVLHRMPRALLCSRLHRYASYLPLLELNVSSKKRREVRLASSLRSKNRFHTPFAYVLEAKKNGVTVPHYQLFQSAGLSAVRKWPLQLYADRCVIAQIVASKTVPHPALGQDRGNTYCVGAWSNELAISRQFVGDLELRPPNFMSNLTGSQCLEFGSEPGLAVSKPPGNDPSCIRPPAYHDMRVKLH